MSEFDANGFSAIDKFFGGEEQNERGGLERQGSNHQTRKRQGVGSSTPLKASQNDQSKRILMVGRKRQRGDDDDDDDVVDDKVRGGFEEDEEDDEAGRTTIAKHKSTKNALTADRLAADSVPKKKLGKKARKKLQQDQNESDKRMVTETKPEEKDNELTVTSTTEANETPTRGKDSSSLVDEEQTQKKPKRRKVRSKQKNIRKDHRDNKPEHLIVGRKQYQGRPLTAETRAKLNLPPPKPRVPHSLDVANAVQEQEDVQGTGLAIDDLLEDTGDHIDAKNAEEVSEKVSKKRRKSKYKNLKL